MSTRATYSISNNHGHFTTFYIHHDGYMQGAAKYLMAAACASSSNASLADAFLRANKRAELTSDHDSHPDTEFRYTIDKDHHLRVDYRAPSEERYINVFAGTLTSFFARVTKEKVVRTGSLYMNQRRALSRIASRVNDCAKAIGSGQLLAANTLYSEGLKYLKLAKEHLEPTEFYGVLGSMLNELGELLADAAKDPQSFMANIQELKKAKDKKAENLLGQTIDALFEQVLGNVAQEHAKATGETSSSATPGSSNTLH